MRFPASMNSGIASKGKEAMPAKVVWISIVKDISCCNKTYTIAELPNAIAMGIPNVSSNTKLRRNPDSTLLPPHRAASQALEHLFDSNKKHDQKSHRQCGVGITHANLQGGRCLISVHPGLVHTVISHKRQKHKNCYIANNLHPF